MRLHHIGIVTKSIDESLVIYEKLGYEKVSGTVTDNIQNNKICFMKNSDSGEVIELIAPCNENSTVYRAKNSGFHHVCYSVPDLDLFIDEFKKKKAGKIFTEKLTAPAIDNKYIIFIYLKNGQIIEIVEET